jgi:ribosome-associated toxin RatA of RatAB toxin-antitoxin module
MMTTPIRAVDERVLPFAPDQIWPVLADVNGYPQRYPPSLHRQVRAVTAAGIGSEVELRPRGGRAFRCRVESLEPPRQMRIRYPGDFIVGTGEWRWAAAAGGTQVVYELDVVSHGRLAAWLGKLLPLGKLHSQFMRAVLENLERETAPRVG